MRKLRTAVIRCISMGRIMLTSAGNCGMGTQGMSPISMNTSTGDKQSLIYRDGVQVAHAILHCLAIPTGFANFRSADEMVGIVRGWHRERGFSDVGYHYIVMPDGTYAHGRPLAIDGAHTLGWNKNTLGIAMAEHTRITKIGAASDYYTPLQLDTVRKLIRRHGITKVTGHNDHAAKLCPGFKVKPSAI